jgi:phosphoribosylformimino-5-aminoimidazole carboxamide ribotide isomerase
MDIIPAIDLSGGQCVRLTQGDFATAKIYEADPALQAKRFAAAGAEWLHIVDLDGARTGARRQTDIIRQIAERSTLRLQVGGGIRETADATALFESGVERVVIGSLAVSQPQRIKDWLHDFGPQRIVIACDVRLDPSGEPRILSQGWREESKQTLWDLVEAFRSDGLRTILCTDIARDGMLEGPNTHLYQTVKARYAGLELLASGGVRNEDDLRTLAQIGVTGAIVGKALYEGRLDLADVVRRSRHAC